MNFWNIPEWLEKEVRARDTKCVYCSVAMLQKVPLGSPRKAVATWEHIINDARIVTGENIARCCCAGNASKGQKPLQDWLQSNYCIKRGIREDTLAQIVRDALASAGQPSNQAMQRAADRHTLHF
ncbi:MAG: HNH endonuclease [Chthoniobacterales bacterium]|nr:HNH endonuclease [Chthoniobacterales bacterium]